VAHLTLRRGIWTIALFSSIGTAPPLMTVVREKRGGQGKVLAQLLIGIFLSCLAPKIATP
jgi:hypothetical protein